MYQIWDLHLEYIKNTYSSIIRKINNLIKKFTEHLNKHFSMEDIQRSMST